MPDFSIRSSAIEIMDNLQCSGNIIDQTLIELDFINKWLGGNAVTFNGLNSILSEKINPSKFEHLTIADLGCGGGDMLAQLASTLKRRKINSALTGIDANPNIIAFATKHTEHFNEIKYQTLNILSDEFRQQHFDIFFATLFFHHFTSYQLIEIFRGLKERAGIGVVINDLHRHWLAYYSIKILTRLFSKSPMVIHDAPLSVLRGFTKKELKEILHQAGIDNYSLKWKWAFRWQLTIFSK